MGGRMTWTRAPLIEAHGFPASRHLLLEDDDGVAVWRLRWTGGGWFLKGDEPCDAGGDGELADAVTVRGLPVLLLADLRWLRGGE